MDGTHFAMASEWMENGNINEFIRVHRDANRFELVGCSIPDDYSLAAQRRRQGVDIYAQPCDDTRRPEGGMT